MQEIPPQPPIDDSPRRNYIRRKRCLNESISMIEKTLICIFKIRKEQVDKNEITKMAKSHASEVEAACWAPRMKMSDDDYQNLMETRTKELCLVLIKKLIPTIDTTHIQPQNQSPASSPPTPSPPVPKSEIKPPSPVVVVPSPSKPKLPPTPIINSKPPLNTTPRKPIQQLPIPQTHSKPLRSAQSSTSTMKQAKLVGMNSGEKPAPILSKPKGKLPTVQIKQPNITPLDPWADFSMPFQDPNENYCFSPSFIDQNMPNDILGEFGIDELSMALDSGPKFADDSTLPFTNFPDTSLL